MNIRYITVDNEHIIEVTQQGFYPRQLVAPQWRERLEGWGFYKRGNESRKFRTEKGARAFLAKQ